MPDAATPIRIVIADDHLLFRDGLRRLLEAEDGFVVVGEARNGREAVERVVALQPDILLLDLAMPMASGLKALEDLAEGHLPVRTVLLTAAIDREATIRGLQLGARGVLLKEAATQMLYRCVRAVMKGEYWVGHERVQDLLELLRERTTGDAASVPASTLTKRELQIVAAITDGCSNRDVGQELGLSEQTVKNHLSHIYDKLGVSNRLELALYAVHHRLLDPEAAGGKRVADV